MLGKAKVLKERKVSLKDILTGKEDHGVVDYLPDREDYLIGVNGGEGERYIFLNNLFSNQVYSSHDLTLELVIYNDYVYAIGTSTIMNLNSSMHKYNLIDNVESTGLKFKENVRGGVDGPSNWSSVIETVHNRLSDKYIDLLIFGRDKEECKEYNEFSSKNRGNVIKDVEYNFFRGNFEMRNLYNEVSRLQINKDIFIIDIIKALESEEALDEIVDYIYTNCHKCNEIMMEHILYNEIAGRMIESKEFSRPTIEHVYHVKEALNKAGKTVIIEHEGEEHKVDNILSNDGYLYGRDLLVRIDEVESVKFNGKELYRRVK